MIKHQITTFHWLQVETKERAKVAEILDLKRSGGGKVYGTKLISDGYTNEDLSGITVEKINNLLKSSYASEKHLKS